MSTALPASRTRIASPWPTSSATICTPEPTGGPTASASIPAASTASRSRARTVVGRGHVAQTTAAAPPHASAPTHAGSASATAALGHDASHPAAAVENPPTAPAASSTTLPSGPHSAAAANPAKPITSAAEMAGPTMRLATGETSDSVPNVPTISGTVHTVATSVKAVGATIDVSHFGRAAAIHSSASRVKNTIPATAATDSWKPRSNALAGSSSRAAAAATLSADPPSVRRPLNHAAETASAITHARTADGWTPESTT